MKAHLYQDGDEVRLLIEAEDSTEAVAMATHAPMIEVDRQGLNWSWVVRGRSPISPARPIKSEGDKR